MTTFGEVLKSAVKLLEEAPEGHLVVAKRRKRSQKFRSLVSRKYQDSTSGTIISVILHSSGHVEDTSLSPSGGSTRKY